MREKRTNMQKFRSGSRTVRFFARKIFGETLPKFIELCMETPCWCPSEGHKHGCPSEFRPPRFGPPGTNPLADLDPSVKIR